MWKVTSNRTRYPRPITGGGPLGYPPPPGEPHPTGPMDEAGGGFGRSPPLARPVVVDGRMGVGLGNEIDPKGHNISPLHVEVWGDLPPGTIHWKGRAWTFPPPRPKHYQGLPTRGGGVCPGRGPNFSRVPPLGGGWCTGGGGGGFRLFASLHGGDQT